MASAMRALRAERERKSAAFREWQRLRPEFDSALWRTPAKRPAANAAHASKPVAHHGGTEDAENESAPPPAHS